MKSEEEMCSDANDTKEIYKSKNYGVFFLEREECLFSFFD